MMAGGRAAAAPGNRSPHRPRGIVTLAAVLTLLALAAWAAAASQQAVVSELRAASSHQRAAEAFEAAQGGLELARVLLGLGALDDHCLPAGVPARALAERLALGPVMLACRQQGRGWSCECPSSGEVAPGAPPAAASPPSATPSCLTFRVELTLAGASGAVLLRSTGRGADGSGTATVAELVRPAPTGSSGSSGSSGASSPSGSPPHWRRVPGTWRDF